MSKDTKVQPGLDAEAGSPAETQPRKRTPDELPDGSGNDAHRHLDSNEEGRFDAG